MQTIQIPFYAVLMALVGADIELTQVADFD